MLFDRFPEFASDSRVHDTCFKFVKSFYRFCNTEYKFGLSSLHAASVLHSDTLGSQMKFISFYQFLTLDVVLSHLTCINMWSSKSLSLSSCFELVASLVLERPIKNSSSYDINTGSIEKELDILSDLKSFEKDLSNIESSSFCDAVLKLSEVDKNLLKDIWSELFPQLWTVLQQDSLKKVPVAKVYEAFIKDSFVRAETHTNKDMDIFVNTVLSCRNLPEFSYIFLKSAGKYPDLLMKVYLKIEDIVLENKLSDLSPNYEIYLRLLLKAYFNLEDQDLLIGFLHQYSKCPALHTGILYHSLGDLREGLVEYEIALKRLDELEKTEFVRGEHEVLLSYRAKCIKVLHNWDLLGNKDETEEPEILPESEALKRYKYLFRAFQENTSPLPAISSTISEFSDLWKKEMKSLSPCLITPKHLSLLHIGKYIKEFKWAVSLQERIREDIEVGLDNYPESNEMLEEWGHDMLSFKDNLYSWIDFTLYRSKQLEQFQYYLVHKIYMDDNTLQSFQRILEKAYDSCFICLAGAFYEHGLPDLSLKSVQNCKNLYMRDIFTELCVESHLLEMKLCKNDPEKQENILKGALIFLKNFTNIEREESVAMLNVYQGLLLKQSLQMNEEDIVQEYGKTIEEMFSMSYEKLTNWCKGWLYCGNYFQEKFLSGNDCKYYKYTLRSFIKSCSYGEIFIYDTMSTEALAKMIWLLSSSDVPLNCRNDIVEEIIKIPLSYLIPWIPQLLATFLKTVDSHLESILNKIGLKHPEYLYFLLHSAMNQRKPIHMSESNEHLYMELMNKLKTSHPMLISTLEKIENELILLSKKATPNTLGVLRRIELKICDIFFMCTTKQIDANSIDKKIQDIFTESSKSLETESDPELKRALRNLLKPSAWKLENIMFNLSECIKLCTVKKKMIKRSFVLDPVSYLSSFRPDQIDIFVNSFVKFQGKYSICTSRILPKIDLVERHGESACRIHVKKTNGKVYPYVILPIHSMETYMNENRVFQLFSFLNDFLQEDPKTFERSLKFSVPTIIPILSQIKIVEDDDTSISLFNTFEKHYAQHVKEKGDMIPLLTYYYELYGKTLSPLDEGTIQKHSELLFCHIQDSMFPKTILKRKFKERSLFDYNEFRKKFSRGISLHYFAQHLFSMNHRIAEKFYIHQDVGKITNFGCIIDYFNEPTAERDVLRITPNISTLITPVGLNGYVKLAMCAAARCLYRHNEAIEFLLKTICLNEITDKVDARASFGYEKINLFVDTVIRKIEALSVKDFELRLDDLITAAGANSTLSSTYPSVIPWL